MPPTGNGSRSVPFIALWVEDGIAKVWRVDLGGPIDEIARFSVEGMPRTTVLEISAQFVKAATRPPRPISPLNAERAAEGKPPLGRPRASTGKPRKDASHGKSRYVPREEQIARQAELSAALARHPEGITAPALAEELGRKLAGAGVPLGVLARQGKARRDEAGVWYPIVANGDSAPPPES